MIFQDPLSSMHPFYTVGNQIIEAYRIHNDVSKKAARAHAIEMLDRVGIPEPTQRVDAYPHQFSGGMRQRAMIAMALSCDPDLLIADEPTTALDVTVQAQILDLIRDLQKEFNSAVIIITHDLGVVAELADDILVMYAGRAVEYGTRRAALQRARTPLHLGAAGLDAALRQAADRAAAADQGHAAQPDQGARRAARSTRAATTRSGSGSACLDRAARAARQRQRPLRGLPHPARRAPEHLGAGDHPEAASDDTLRTRDDRPAPAARARPSPCSRSRGWSSTSRSSGGFLQQVRRAPSRRSTAWTSTYAAARRSRSWASPAAARAPPPG